MKHWLVDTNVLLDVVGADAEFGERSRAALERCATEGVLVIDPVIYAEVSVFIDTIEELDELLPHSLLRRDGIPWTASFLAGKAYLRHRRQKGGGRRMLADFLIGAHAAVEGFALLSRDTRYARYFDVEVLDPAAM